MGEGGLAMTDRRVFFAVALPMFLFGLVCGGGLVMSRPSPPELWELWPEFRREEVDAMYADFRAGRVRYTAELPVLDGRLKVRVVEEVRGAHYGFVPLNEVGHVPDHFWYYKNHEFDINKYDTLTLFVSIKERHARTLHKIAGASSVGPGSKGRGALSNEQ
jgi:hypothetical protein